MSEFRAYVIGWDGHILQRIELDNCSDESEAREKAKQLVDGHDVELWERARLIERFRHQEQSFCVRPRSRFSRTHPWPGSDASVHLTAASQFCSRQHEVLRNRGWSRRLPSECAL
jgi:hypothetical protein